MLNLVKAYHREAISDSFLLYLFGSPRLQYWAGFAELRGGCFGRERLPLAPGGTRSAVPRYGRSGWRTRHSRGEGAFS